MVMGRDRGRDHELYYVVLIPACTSSIARPRVHLDSQPIRSQRISSKPSSDLNLRITILENPTTICAPLSNNWLSSIEAMKSFNSRKM